jgi:S1-C subfamily serine protease
MRLALTCLALLVAVCPVFAERAKSPSDATVLVRLVGSLRAEIDNVGQKSVITRDHVEIGSGSGFVISPDGHVLTNEHVVNNTEITINEPNRKVVIRLNVSRIEVCFPPESAAVRGGTTPCAVATIAAADPDLDLAVLYVSGSNQPYLALGDSDVVTPGQPVQALGFPFGRTLDVGRDTLDSVVPEITTTVGAISALRANNAGERRFLQIDGNVNSGSSGGPIVSKDGFVVGVVVARLRDASNIAFAIPINQAKSFIESRGLDQLMPTRRLRLGGLQRFDAKGIALRLPEDLADASPFRSRLDSDSGPTEITMRVDRVMSPWMLNRLEQELVKTQAFERGSIATNESRTTRVGTATALMGRASGNAENGAEIGMAYALMDLGREKIVARFVGPAEQLAFNESVLRDALVSIETDRLIAGELDPVDKLEWHAISAERRVPLPVGWLVEPGAPSSCTGLSNPGAAGVAVPIRDFTVALRVAIWSGAVGPDEAASNCSSRRGSLGQASYTTRTDWLGVSYTVEGVFVRVGPQQVLQLEVVSPDQKSAYARALLAAWVKKATE